MVYVLLIIISIKEPCLVSYAGSRMFCSRYPDEASINLALSPTDIPGSYLTTVMNV